jgi:endonuclease YncB( thermonuclease family)
MPAASPMRQNTATAPGTDPVTLTLALRHGLPSQADPDRYGRFLRYVERKNRDVGRAQVFLGLATVYVYPNHPLARTHDYRRAEHQSGNQRRGLWQDCWQRG